jgi:hypothetical protein
MVALMFVVAALAAVSLGLGLLYRWARKFDEADGDETRASGTEDPGGFAHLGIAEAAHSGASSRS